MKILWICPFFPYPPDNGSRIRGYFITRELARWNEVSIFSLIQSAEEGQNLAPLREYCREVKGVLPENKRPEAFFDGRRGMKDVLPGFLVPEPRHFYGPPSPNVIRELHECLREGHYDVMIINHLLMTNYTWDFLGKPGQPLRILSQENVESLIQRQYISLARGVPIKLRKILYYLSFIRFERKACLRFDHVAVCSANDRSNLLKFVPHLAPERVSLLPNGVDTAWYDIGEVPVEEATLIYNGSLTYEANYDAVKYFLAEIFPLIQNELPAVKLKITGKTNGVDLAGLPLSENVIFTGYVADIRPVVKSSTVCIVPLQVGGGTRLKVLEAMAAGTPVVATSKGAEGLQLEPDRDFLLADTAEDFARQVLRLLNNPELRNEISRNGRQAVDERYGWQGIAHNFHLQLETLAQSTAGGQG